MAESSSTELPPIMRCWEYSVPGQPSTVLGLSIRSTSKPCKGHVIIRVSHVALNPVGSMFIMFTRPGMPNMPHIPEFDFAGTIAATGRNVRAELTPGTSVFGTLPLLSTFLEGSGALAEFVLCPQDYVAIRPPTISLSAAAGLGITGITAIQALDAARVKPGHRVLINGGSGGVGVMAIQMARVLVGPYGTVTATCSMKNADFVRSLGANEIIDYHTHAPLSLSLATEYRNQPFDAVIDAVGADLKLFKLSPTFLKPDGTFVALGVMFPKTFKMVAEFGLATLQNQFLPVWLGGTPRRYKWLNVKPNAIDLERLRQMVEREEVKNVVDSQWIMNDARKAYDRLNSNHATGKVIVKVSKWRDALSFTLMRVSDARRLFADTEEST